MNFEIALRLIKAGHTVRLKQWSKSTYLVLKNKEVRLFDSGTQQEWRTFNADIISSQWEVIEPMTFYDQGYKNGHENGWDEALSRYLHALENSSSMNVATLENSRSIITTLQEKKDV